MNFGKITYVYFVGIGGIGMSALARYFAFMGKKVYGYDRSPTSLTRKLEAEGIAIHYSEDLSFVEGLFSGISKEFVLVVYTPAISSNNSEFAFFKNGEFCVKKRSEVLGLISKNRKVVAISGTHGKTSVTTTSAHILKQSAVDCSAFLGGISNNYGTNFLFSKQSDFVVVEADEYDRSFHQLFPQVALVTSMDADHLDIYGTHQAVLESFNVFFTQINTGGVLIHKKGLPVCSEVFEKQGITVLSYSVTDAAANYYAKDITLGDGGYSFVICTPCGNISISNYLLPGLVNIENAVASVAIAQNTGVENDEIKRGLESFLGVKRRFEYHIKKKDIVFIDDYAHHPEELKACIGSVKDMFLGKRIAGVFQPHLYSRTNHFASEFAESLNMLDSVYLLDIYPAREMPIEGVSSQLIFDKITLKNKKCVTKETLFDALDRKQFDILLTMGAGDIDTLVEPLKAILLKD